MLHSFMRKYEDEANRRRSRVSSMRQKKAKVVIIDKNNEKFQDIDGEEQVLKKTNEESKLKEIMIVRTIEESLSPSKETLKIIQLQRKRRLLKRHLDEVRKDVRNSIKTSPQNSISELSSVSSTCSSVSFAKFHVRFSDVSIRDYPIILGDNPSVMTGPPLSIDWEFISELTFDLNVYEKYRKRKRRLHNEFKMPLQTRIETLLNLGFSMKEIRQAAKQATVTRKQRALTIKRTMRPANLDAAIQVLRRKFEKPLRSRKGEHVVRNKKKLTSPTKSIGSETTCEGNDHEKVTERNDIVVLKEELSNMDVTKRTSNYDLLSFDKTIIEEGRIGMNSKKVETELDSFSNISCIETESTFETTSTESESKSTKGDHSKLEIEHKDITVVETSNFDRLQHKNCPHDETVEKKYKGEEQLVVLLEDGINFKFFDESIFCLPACGFFLWFFEYCSS